MLTVMGSGLIHMLLRRVSSAIRYEMRWSVDEGRYDKKDEVESGDVAGP